MNVCLSICIERPIAMHSMSMSVGSHSCSWQEVPNSLRRLLGIKNKFVCRRGKPIDSETPPQNTILPPELENLVADAVVH